MQIYVFALCSSSMRNVLLFMFMLHHVYNAQVEEAVEDAPQQAKKAARGFGGLFGRAKDSAAEAEQAVEDAAEEAAPQATRKVRNSATCLCIFCSKFMVFCIVAAVEQSPNSFTGLLYSAHASMYVLGDRAECVQVKRGMGGLFSKAESAADEAEREAQRAAPKATAAAKDAAASVEDTVRSTSCCTVPHFQAYRKS